MLYLQNKGIKCYLNLTISSLVISRQLAETSPYLEALRKRDIEVLFLYEGYDELVLMNLGQFDRKNLKSIENELYEDKEDTDTVDAAGIYNVHFF